MRYLKGDSSVNLPAPKTCLEPNRLLRYSLNALEKLKIEIFSHIKMRDLSGYLLKYSTGWQLHTKLRDTVVVWSDQKLPANTLLDISN